MRLAHSTGSADDPPAGTPDPPAARRTSADPPAARQPAAHKPAEQHPAADQPGARKPVQPPHTRRRGAALEQALLQAAWEQLQAEGYGHFSFETVAARAGTSKSVIYRRWRTTDELIRATIRMLGERTPRATPDTGSLRGDLLALLRLASTEHSQMLSMFSVLLASYYDGSKLSFAAARQEFIGDRQLRTTAIFERAAARGEIDLARLTPRLTRLPFDLFRNEFVLTMQPLPDTAIEEIVDQIVMPLLVATGAGPAGPAQPTGPSRDGAGVSPPDPA